MRKADSIRIIILFDVSTRGKIREGKNGAKEAEIEKKAEEGKKKRKRKGVEKEGAAICSQWTNCRLREISSLAISTFGETSGKTAKPALFYHLVCNGQLSARDRLLYCYILLRWLFRLVRN